MLNKNLIGMLMTALVFIVYSCQYDEPCNCTLPATKSKILVINDSSVMTDMSVTTRNPNIIGSDTTRGTSIYYYTFTGVLGISEVLFRFDLSDISKTAKINKAVLTLYDIENLDFKKNTSDTVFLFKITEDWIPAQTNWNNKPNYSVNDSIFVPEDLNIANKYSEYNITRFVEDWVKNPEQNYGMLMQLADLWLYHGFDFWMSEYPNVAYRPRLEIEYEE